MTHVPPRVRLLNHTEDTREPIEGSFSVTWTNSKESMAVIENCKVVGGFVKRQVACVTVSVAY